MEEERTMILFEGNITSGKSTVLETLAATEEWGTIQEPVKLWRNWPITVKGKIKYINLLDLFYRKPKRWAFTFQMAAFTTRTKNWTDVLKLNDHSTMALERSVFCDRNIFAWNCLANKSMKPIEWDVYRRMWNFEFRESHIAIPDLIVYYRVSPQVCFDRLPLHERQEENAIAPQYLMDLHELHERWLYSDDSGTAPLILPEQNETEFEEIPRVPVLVLDGERSWTAQELTSAINERLALIQN